METDAEAMFFYYGAWAIVLFIYFLPAICAYALDKDDVPKLGVFLWNIAIGWSGFGWLILLWYVFDEGEDENILEVMERQKAEKKKDEQE